MTINERIREARQVLDLTQTKFAERIAVSTSHLAGLEIGDKKVGERIIKLICSEFGVDERWLRTGGGEMFGGETNIKSAKLMSLFKSLSPEFQDFVLKQLMELSELNTLFKK